MRRNVTREDEGETKKTSPRMRAVATCFRSGKTSGCRCTRHSRFPLAAAFRGRGFLRFMYTCIPSLGSSCVCASDARGRTASKGWTSLSTCVSFRLRLLGSSSRPIKSRVFADDSGSDASLSSRRRHLDSEPISARVIRGPHRLASSAGLSRRSSRRTLSSAETASGRLLFEP